MNDLALINRPAPGMADLRVMADAVVSSKLFPDVRTAEVAMTLMMLCQAEGLHPIQALRRYHLIQGRPSLKADTMLADFMRHGGRVNWAEHSSEKCTGVFSSPGHPEPCSVTWTLADAKTAQLTSNPMWSKYPRQMLRSRVASEGIRMTMPEVIMGMYTPEEVESFAAPMVGSSITPEQLAYLSDLRGKPTPALVVAPAPRTKEEKAAQLEEAKELVDAILTEANDELTAPVDIYNPETGEQIGVASGATAKQLAHIHAMKDELGISDEKWRARLMELFGKASSKDLSAEEVGVLILKLEESRRRWGGKTEKANRGKAGEGRKAANLAHGAPIMADFIRDLESKVAESTKAREPGEEG